MKNKILITILTLISGVIISGLIFNTKFDRITINKSPQRTGDPVNGYDYLVNGNYVSSGIPYDLAAAFLPKDSSNFLKREGDASLIPAEFNLTQHMNGTRILSPNCLTCHSDKINGEFIVGLGNTTFDYSINTQAIALMLSNFIKNKYTLESKEFESYKAFKNAANALSNNITTEVRGVNPADKLTSVLVAHRDPVNLNWYPEPQLEIPEETIPTDVPAWWLLKKKNAMFSTGIGRGDFSRFLMASSLLTFKDSTEAAEIDRQFPNVLAWINTIEPPKYTGTIDSTILLKGKKLFDLNCSTCHGHYDGQNDYPNYLISLEEIGTDPELSKAYTDGLYSNFIEWYKSSWFTTGNSPGRVVVESGYVAPPLDGVWATGPYLHNGSVPNIDVLLNSKARPKYWRRSFDSFDYDMQKLGWKYESLESKIDRNTYDTTIPAYRNTGHTFGDDLNDDERLAVIEYLKTL